MTPYKYVVQLGDDLYGPFDTKDEAFAWVKAKDGPIVILTLYAP